MERKHGSQDKMYTRKGPSLAIKLFNVGLSSLSLHVLEKYYCPGRIEVSGPQWRVPLKFPYFIIFLMHLGCIQRKSIYVIANKSFLDAPISHCVRRH